VKISETQFQFEVPAANTINHLCVFMTGVAPLPADMAAGIYLSWSPFTNWSYLGFINNDKPSAIFKIGSSATSASQSTASSTFGSSTSSFSVVSEAEEPVVSMTETCTPFASGASSSTTAVDCLDARLGLSIEPLSSIMQQQQQQRMQRAASASSGASFSSSALAPVAPTSSAITISRAAGEELLVKASRRLLQHFYNYALSFASGGLITVDALQRWLALITSRLRDDPTFLSRDSDA
jgi:hypothetical protein